ncbi:HK97 family phage prohead protease [Priestia aryabhattai]|uniref:HK97 family phage prohead protease n=1 Tax=Priestia aryabhattai TaxID=412384 RepID=UPI002E2271F9|nr:HK97 family phage prohead protease [Priestia aryabhattai]MED4022001.1 HK97 family phage prohead protease [Priestia aryabhattai]
MALNKFELRFNDDINMKTTNDGLLVSGYVNKTNQWSQKLGQRKKFVERILPGAFRKALQNGNEIHFLAEHDNNKILATTRNDSLTLREDDNGLYMEARISPTSWGKDYHQLITDGIIKNMSFGMAVLKDEWDKLADGTYERSISDLALFEVSAVRSPAYVQSTIAARSIEVIEDVEIPEEKAEKRELTLQEQLKIKKANLNRFKFIAEDGNPTDAENIKKAEGEIRKMEATLNKQTTNKVDILNTDEKRMVTTKPNNYGTDLGTMLSTPMDIVRQQAEKMNNTYSLVGRTNITVQKNNKLKVLLENAEDYNKNLFVDEENNIDYADFNGVDTIIETKRLGTGIEVSQLLLEKSDVEEQEKIIDLKLLSRLNDSLDYSMLTGNGNMGNLTADSSVSKIIEIENAVQLENIFELTDSVSTEYQEGAVFIMHKNMLRNLRNNKEFTADYLSREIDSFSGKNIYHLDGFPILLNNNIPENQILFGHLYHGFKTVISEGLKIITQDIYGNKIYKEVRSFESLKTADTTRAANHKPIYVMDAYVGGKVINKDCFVRLDVKTA